MYALLLLDIPVQQRPAWTSLYYVRPAAGLSRASTPRLNIPALCTPCCWTSPPIYAPPGHPHTLYALLLDFPTHLRPAGQPRASTPCLDIPALRKPCWTSPHTTTHRWISPRIYAPSGHPRTTYALLPDTTHPKLLDKWKYTNYISTLVFCFDDYRIREIKWQTIVLQTI